MSERIVGVVARVNGPVIHARGVTDAMMMELVFVGEARLVGEIVKLTGDRAIIQVYEDTTGVHPTEEIYGSGMPLSVELGPGLIGTIYDGIQRPLERIRDLTDQFIARGIQVPGLSREARHAFVPKLAEGTELLGGEILGTVQETPRIEHRVLVPPDTRGRLEWIAGEGDYGVADTVAVVKSEKGQRELSLMQRWPIRRPRPTSRRNPIDTPLITGQRVIDTLFPLGKGGTVAIPGGFGTGKTMTQHAVAKWCDADIIVYIGCGERGNEMTDVLTEFPELVDPRTGQSLMERTLLIANTSNMPVSAREASIYTGITLAEYYRDQGYHVAVMADSTSRWAEALRELSGRMEEMPAEEGFPAYLPTRIAEFYERAGSFDALSGNQGSVSIIGAVSPPGGDFSEPVTQHTKRFVRGFWALDRQLANARHYPAISWLDSYSEYVDEIAPWWEEHAGASWVEDRREIMDLLQREVRLKQVVKLVGPDALPDSQRFVLEVATLFKNAFLQQNAFDDVDRYSTVEKQLVMLRLILTYWRRGSEVIRSGVTLVQLRRMKVLTDINRMKMTVENDKLDQIEKLQARLERSLDRLESPHA
ncbi:MAG: V-type ATP synthase subunit A [Spirochaetaceae bacterium]